MAKKSNLWGGMLLSAIDEMPLDQLRVRAKVMEEVRAAHMPGEKSAALEKLKEWKSWHLVRIASPTLLSDALETMRLRIEKLERKLEKRLIRKRDRREDPRSIKKRKVSHDSDEESESDSEEESEEDESEEEEEEELSPYEASDDERADSPVAEEDAVF